MTSPKITTSAREAARTCYQRFSLGNENTQPFVEQWAEIIQLLLDAETERLRKEIEWLKANDTALGASRDKAREERDNLRSHLAQRVKEGEK